MSTILQADSTGTLHLPPSVLPEARPGQRYRVMTQDGTVTVGPAETPAPSPEEIASWIEELQRRRVRGVTGVPGTPVEQILDEDRRE